MKHDRNSAKDSKVFEILTRENHRRLLAFDQSLVKNHTAAEDIVQDALVTAYNKIEQFDQSKCFAAWVRGIIKLKYFEWLRKNKDVQLEDQLLEYLEATHNEWDEAENGRAVVSYLTQCMKKLPDALLRATEMFYMKNMSGKAVAERLDTSEDTIRKRLQRARIQLGSCIRAKLN